MNPNLFLRTQTARIGHVFSPLTHTIPPLWLPTVPAPVLLRGLEALLSDSTASKPGSVPHSAPELL